MSIIQEKENNFKFGLYQDDKTFCEVLFEGDVYNPFVRYSVDIRDMIPGIVSRLQRSLSKKTPYSKVDVGNKTFYDLEAYREDMIDLYPEDIQDNLREKPKKVSKTFSGKNTMTGVEFKFGLFINNKTIVERFFYVNNYDDRSLTSYELTSEVNYTVELIKDYLKNADMNHIWFYLENGYWQNNKMN